MDLITVLLVIVGGLLLLFGFRIYLFLIGAIGFSLGSGIAYLYLAAEGTSTGLQLLLTVVVGLIGASLLISIHQFLIALPGFLGGGAVGAGIALESGLGDAGALALGLVLAIIGAAIALFVFKFVMVLLTAFVGASFLTLSVTGEDLEMVLMTQSLEPLAVDVTGSLFLLVFAVGVLVQFGLITITGDPDDEHD